MKYLAHAKKEKRIEIANEVSKRVKAQLAKGEKYSQELWNQKLTQVLFENGFAG